MSPSCGSPDDNLSQPESAGTPSIADLPCPIPYQGSKRRLAPTIIACLPPNFSRLHEPFAGSAAVAIATALARPTIQVILNDTNAALMGLWTKILEGPDALADEYARLWNAQLSDPRTFYDAVRAEFNATQRPELLLYLLARCVKAAVRYNANGEFNQSPDNRRLGSRPSRMRRQLRLTSAILSNRTELRSADFATAVVDADPDDVIYMDPPYQGVSTPRDRRYVDVLRYDDFVDALEAFNERGLSFIVSYDGRTGSKTHGRPLPNSLRLAHLELDAGRSTQATLRGHNARTIESLYLSPSLIDRLGGLPTHSDFVDAGSPQTPAKR